MDLEKFVIEIIAVGYSRLSDEGKKEANKLLAGDIRPERIDLQKFKRGGENEPLE